jgi:hypothetical protein
MEAQTKTAGDPFRIRVAFLIAVVSMAGAFVTARASLLSVRASDLDQLSLQQLVQQQQLLADIEGEVAQDRRLFGRYQEHVLAWRLLEKDAAEARGQLAEDLEAQARERLALARSMRPFFSFRPDLGDDDGRVEYDPAFTRRHLVDTTVELGDLRPEDTFATAQGLHVQIVRLIGVAALLIAALVFLTLAQLIRPAVRRTFAASGVVVFVVGVILFAVVEVAGP